jgi:hypothetical protein
MKTIAALVLATVIASPVLAQSYDPDLGTGNIAPTAAVSSHRQAVHESVQSKFGNARAQAPASFNSGDAGQFDRAKGYID